jgi:hypothetical protein
LLQSSDTDDGHVRDAEGATARQFESTQGEQQERLHRERQQEQRRVTEEREQREAGEREVPARSPLEERDQEHEHEQSREALPEHAQHDKEQRREGEALEREVREREEREKVCIHFKIRENNTWRDLQDLWVRASDTSEVMRVSKKNMRKGLRLLDTNMQLLAPKNPFESITSDRRSTIMMIPQRELNIDDRALDSTNLLGYEAIVEGERWKWQARWSIE